MNAFETVQIPSRSPTATNIWLSNQFGYSVSKVNIFFPTGQVEAFVSQHGKNGLQEAKATIEGRIFAEHEKAAEVLG